MEMLGETMIVKAMGTSFDQILKKVSRDEAGNIQYMNITFMNDSSVGNVEIGVDVDLEDEMVVVGENATIVVKGDWWNTGYFEV